MRVLAAGGRFYWARAMMAGFAVLSCLQWFNFNSTGFAGATVGQGGLGMLSLIGIVMAFGAVVVTADCVCHERREGTLPLLFLSTIKSHDVVLGKLAAMGLVSLYALIGFAPVLMLTLLTGGVTGGEVARTALVLVNILFLSLTTGLLVSVYARSQFEAFLNSFALLASLTLAPFFLEIIGRTTLRLPLSICSPIFSFYRTGDLEYTTEPAVFWLSLCLSHLIGWLLLVVSTVVLARNWRKLHEPRAVRSTVPQSRRLISAPRVLLQGRDNKHRTFAPVARAVLRLPRQQALAWFAAVISILGSVWNSFVMNRLGSVWAAASVSVVFSFASFGVFAFLAGRFFFESRRSGELELLLVTPVGAKGILREQRLALLRMLRGPFYLVLLGSIPVAACAVSVNTGNELVGLVLGLSQLANTALGILAVGSVGMWFGTRVNSTLAIVGYSVGLVEVLPLGAVYLLPIPFSGTTGVFQFWPLIVPLLFVGKNLFFIWWAWVRLRSEFRTRDRSVLDGLFRRIFSTATVELPEPRPQTAP